MGIASDFVLIVMAGLVGGLAARILRLPLMVGYVAAGVLIGPHTAGPTVVQIHDIELLAEIGVALLLFSSGLEWSFRDLQPVRRVTLIGGPIQIVVTGGLAALALTQGFGMPAREAIWFGAMISVSSTAVVLKTLSAAGVTQTLASRLMIGLLVVQDLAVVPMLVVLPQLGAADHLIASLARAVGIAAAMLGAIVVLGTRLLPKLLHFVMIWGSNELFVVSVVAIGVGVGFATQFAAFHSSWAQSPHRLNPIAASLHLRSTWWSTPHAASQGQNKDLVRLDQNTGNEQLLTSIRPLRGGCWEAPARGCREEGITLDCGAVQGGVAGPIRDVREVSHRVIGCSDFAVESEQYAGNLGMVRRVKNTIAGPVTYDLVLARVGNIVIDASPTPVSRSHWEIPRPPRSP